MKHLNLKPSFNASCASLALLTALSLGACSSGSNNSGGGGGMASPPGVGFSLSGDASKGLILNGYVSVVDAADEANELDSGRTDSADGSYDVTVPASTEFDGPFVKVTVTGGEGATMICDAAPGCAVDIDFGDSIAIDDTLSLSAIIPTPADGAAATSNVTALTDMAAALAQAQQPLTQTRLNSANNGVAQLFGIVSSDLNALPVVNLVDPQADGSNQDAITAAAVSGGILQTALEDPAGIGSALTNLSSSFANNANIVVNEGAQDNISAISLEEILRGAGNVLAVTPVESSTLELVEIAIAADELEAIAQEPGTLSDDIDPNRVEELLALEEAKAFIADLQLIQAAAERDDTAENFENFADALEEANEEFNPSYTAITDAVSALLEARDVQLDSEERLSFGLPNVSFDELSPQDQPFFPEAFFDENGMLTRLVTNGFDVDVTDGGTVFTIDSQDVEIEVTPEVNETVTVDLVMTLTDSFTATQSTEELIFGFSFEERLMGDLAVDITGSTQSEAATINVSSATISANGFEQINLVDAEFPTGEPFSAFTDVTAEEFSIAQFDVTLEAVLATASQDAIFEGVVQLGVTDFGLDSFRFITERFPFNGNVEAAVETDNVSSSLAAASLGLSGNFQANGSSANITFMLDLNDVDLTDGPEQEIVQTMTITGNTAIRESEISDTVETFSLVTREDADALIVELIEMGLSDVPQFDENGLFQPPAVRDFRIDPNAATVFTIVIDDGVFPIYIFLDIAAFFNFNSVPEGFDFSEQLDNFIEVLNLSATATRQRVGETICFDNGAVYYIPPYSVETDFTEISGFRLTQDESSACEPNNLGLPFTGFLDQSNIDRTQTLDFDGTVALSITQDIVGIDPDDPSVTLDAVGNVVSREDGEADADISFGIEFAGRRYQSNIISFNDLEEQLAENQELPLIITNQDDIVLTLIVDDAGDVSGTLSRDQEIFATLSEETGGLLVTYTDGTFTSIL